jgi:hypothetical protein
MADEFELPEAFHDADRESLETQARFVTSTRVQLVTLVIASGVGVFSWAAGRFEITALVAGIAFLGAAALRFRLLRQAPHRRWYEGRAVAESLKTLAWRYAVGGDPFALGDASAEDFRDHARAVAAGHPAQASGTLTPTSSMEQLRAAPLDRRRAAYIRGRIEDQFKWYSAKSGWNQGRARFWSAVVLGFQLAGAAGAFLQGFGLLWLDLFGLAAALAASGAAWLETKQHGTLASAYRVAADELARIRQLAHEETTEASWARFVAESEEAISREHTMWKATASQVEPPGIT